MIIKDDLKQMHREADAYHSKFKERWGIELKEVLF
jgi:hypothetical protein